MSFDFGSVATMSVDAPAGSDHKRTHQIRPRLHSCKITAQDERVRGACAGSWIVALAAPDFLESGVAIEPTRRRIVFVHFQGDGARAESSKPAQVQVKQLA